MGVCVCVRERRARHGSMMEIRVYVGTAQDGDEGKRGREKKNEKAMMRSNDEKQWGSKGESIRTKQRYVPKKNSEESRKTGNSG
jgi:hypothetical protein